MVANLKWNLQYLFVRVAGLIKCNADEMKMKY